MVGLTLVPTPGAPTATAATPDDIIAVVVDGVGNGHGRGMSQWGAYGWAVDQGWNWVQILDHYYGGTSNTSVGAGQIRVRLLGLDGMGRVGETVGLVSHGGGVSWNGTTRTSREVHVRRNGHRCPARPHGEETGL